MATSHSITPSNQLIIHSLSLQDNDPIINNESYVSIEKYSKNNNLNIEKETKFIVVCAIDFGSTYSGYAYAYSKFFDAIHIMKVPNSTIYNPTMNQKIPTILLLDNNENFVAFGYEAKTLYQNMPNSETLKYNYFDRYKMNLHYSNKINPNLLITSSKGTYHNAMKIFSITLEYLKKLFLDEIQSESSIRIKDEQIKWVITVPSIWLEDSKQFMRLAAYKAGIGSENNPKQLQITLEPEAASLYCRSLRLRDCIIDDNISTNDINKTVNNTIKFNKYLVIDCGGGTVDISIHEIDPKNNSLKELHPSIGGPIGSLMIDQMFENLFYDILGKDYINMFKNKYSSNWIDIIDSIDIKKRNLKAYTPETINIPIPYNMIRSFKKYKKIDLPLYLKKRKYNGISWSNQGAITISYTLIKNIFQVVVNQIKLLINKIISKPELNDIKYAFLVGGFSNSFILQNELRTEFNNHLTIITPSDSSLSILKGAVMFGLDSNAVRIRRLSYSYGVRCLQKFDPSIHSESKKITLNGINYCKDLFNPFVTINQSVGIKEKFTKILKKNNLNQHYFSFAIYRTKNATIKYVTDQGVEKCGQFSCELPPNYDDYDIRIIFCFGKTEINIKVLDNNHHKLHKSKINFFSY